MLPKIPKSQFRTPFRGHTASSQSSQTIQCQSQDPLLATTPNLGMACSQMSTPGITVEAIKALIRKPPSKKTTVGDRVINKKLPSKNVGTKKSESLVSSYPVQRKSENDIHMAKKTDSVSRKEKRSKNERSDGHSKVKNRRVAPGTVKDHDSSECRQQSEAMAYTRQARDCESLNQGEDESQVIPVQVEAADNNSMSRKKVQAVRHKVQKHTKKTMQTPHAPVISQKTGNNMVKKRAKRNDILEKWYPSYNISSNRENMIVRAGSSVDHVVMVKEDDYVYRDVIEESVCGQATDPAAGTDVYLFTSALPEEQTTFTGKHVASKRWRKDLIRLQVLKTIYKMETELAVLRDRRKQLGSKLKKYSRTTCADSRSGPSLQ